MTEIEPIDWEARLRQAVEKTLRERAARRAERQEFAVRRMHGLAARHASKLARKKEKRTMIMQPYPILIRLKWTQEPALIIGWESDEGGMRPVVAVYMEGSGTIIYNVGADEIWSIVQTEETP